MFPFIVLFLFYNSLKSLVFASSHFSFTLKSLRLRYGMVELRKITVCKNHILCSETDSGKWYMKEIIIFPVISRKRDVAWIYFAVNSVLVKPYLIINLVGRMKYILTEWVCRILVCGFQHTHYPVLFISVSKMRPVTWFHNVYQFESSINASAYVLERDYLLPPVCTCCVQCVFAQRQCLCQYRHGLCLQVLYVPDPEYVSSVGSSPSLSPISPLSPTSSEADLEKVTVCWPRLTHCPTLRKWPSLLTFTFCRNQRIFSTCIMKWTKWSFVVTCYLIVELWWLKCIMSAF